MARRGKLFEEIIKMLESVKLPQGAKIESPAYIIDKISGNKREVDILINYYLGNILVNIIIECRDRISKGDVTWIEQIKTKRDDLNIDKAIAVSKVGFTKGAKAKAKAYSIEVRELKELTFELVESWCSAKDVNFTKQLYNIVGANMKVDPFINSSTPNVSPFDKLFFDEMSDTKVSLDDLFKLIAPNLKVWKEIKQNSSLKKEILLDISDEKHQYFVFLNDKKHRVLKINYLVIFSIDRKKIPLTDVRSYQSSEESKEYSQLIEYSDNEVSLKNINSDLN